MFWTFDTFLFLLQFCWNVSPQILNISPWILCFKDGVHWLSSETSSMTTCSERVEIPAGALCWTFEILLPAFPKLFANLKLQTELSASDSWHSNLVLAFHFPPDQQVFYSHSNHHRASLNVFLWFSKMHCGKLKLAEGEMLQHVHLWL